MLVHETHRRLCSADHGPGLPQAPQDSGRFSGNRKCLTSSPPRSRHSQMKTWHCPGLKHRSASLVVVLPTGTRGIRHHASQNLCREQKLPRANPSLLQPAAIGTAQALRALHMTPSGVPSVAAVAVFAPNAFCLSRHAARVAAMPRRATTSGWQAMLSHKAG